MSWLANAALSVLHFLYICVTTLIAWKSRPSRHSSQTGNRIPPHLALLLVAEDYSEDYAEQVRECLLESVYRATSWCRTVGVRKLTVYDRHGLLSKNLMQLSQRLSADEMPGVEAESSESDIEYPLTPPLSDVADSRPLSPFNTTILDLNVDTLEYPTVHSTLMRRISGVKRRRKQCKETAESTTPLTTNIVSRASGKPAIAQAANVLVGRGAGRKISFSIDVKELNSIIEGEGGFSSPDLMIVYNVFPNMRGRQPPLEFHGFPPWQARLTEFYHSEHFQASSWWRSQHSSRLPEPVDESEFSKALAQYSKAEMRMGR